MDIKYTQLNIGCLSRNKFWGEPQDNPQRTAVCTSTLIALEGGEFLLVDPGLPYEHMKECIFNRRGVSIELVKAIFITHFHGDHLIDLDRYDCPIYASKEEIALVKSPLPFVAKPYENPFPGIKAIVLPGHTPGIAGLEFVSDGFNVLVAGDIVMTKDFYLSGEGFHNNADMEALAQSLRYINDNYDIVVPGHDVQFFVK